MRVCSLQHFLNVFPLPQRQSGLRPGGRETIRCSSIIHDGMVILGQADVVAAHGRCLVESLTRSAIRFRHRFSMS